MAASYVLQAMDMEATGSQRKPFLEEQLAGIVQQLLTDHQGAKDAIGSLEAIYHASAERLRYPCCIGPSSVHACMNDQHGARDRDL